MQVSSGLEIRVVGPELVRPFEADGRLPELINVGKDTLYRILYDDSGVGTGAIRYTGEEVVARYAAFMERLWSQGEDFTAFFDREVAPLPPPRSAGVPDGEGARDPVWYLHAAHAARLAIASHAARLVVDSPPPGMAVPTFADRDAALGWIEVERDSLVAATRAAEGLGLDRVVWQLAGVLGYIYAELNVFDDWFTTSGIGLEAARRVGDRGGEAELLRSLARACTQSDRIDEGAAYQREVLAIRRELGDAYGEAEALNGLGLLALRRWRLEEARRYFEESLAGFRALGEPREVAVLIGNVALVCCELERLTEAETLARQALSAFRELGARHSEGHMLRALSRTLRQQGRLEEARDSAEAALVIAKERDDRVDEGYWLLDLGAVQLALGQPDAALISYHRSGVIQRQIGDRTREALAWDGTGLAYQRLGRPDEAVAFHRLAADVHRALGDDWHLALDLDHLAAALRDADRRDEARPHWDQALQLLAAYDDPAAVRTREEIERALREG